MASTTEAIHPPTAPVIFQCASCRTIIGDSYAHITSHIDLNTFTLSSAPNITIREPILLSTDDESADKGCTYSELACAGCEATLGKMYRTTLRTLDEIRDMYTISLPAATLYEVGTTNSNVDIPQGASGTYLLDKLTKLQSLVVALHERLESLESQPPSLHQNGNHDPQHLLPPAQVTESTTMPAPTRPIPRHAPINGFHPNPEADEFDAQGRSKRRRTLVQYPADQPTPADLELPPLQYTEHHPQHYLHPDHAVEGDTRMEHGREDYYANPPHRPQPLPPHQQHQPHPQSPPREIRRGPGRPRKSEAARVVPGTPRGTGRGPGRPRGSTLQRRQMGL
ncbi:hypothetical protein SAICODRAFT_31532 [Saitoella complicata NRRL Y-17804]|nr:uncharacterized protein SAICODRAFT_31532 [Saitoella complicata NRRL Y-17804]ODQ51009.1 hypothetical protein SAICODRAFT_31532 [Saitoella complicata NRRL Y-17804]